MIFVEFTDREDKLPISIKVETIQAVKKAISNSMVLGEVSEEFTLIRCKDNVTYQVNHSYTDVLNAIIDASWKRASYIYTRKNIPR